MPLQTSDKNVAHKDTHAQLAALMIPLDEVKVTTQHTTPHLTTRTHRVQATNYLLAASEQQGLACITPQKFPKIIVSFKINLCYPGKPLWCLLLPRAGFVGRSKSLRPAA